ncbi:hypothetical protein GCM10027344_08000 [Spelaeicoccus albus]
MATIVDCCANGASFSEAGKELKNATDDFALEDAAPTAGSEIPATSSPATALIATKDSHALTRGDELMEK